MISMSLRQSDNPNEKVTILGDGRFRVDSFFDITYELSSSSPPAVDSFFDIFTTIEFTPTGVAGGGTWNTEIVSMDLRGSSPAPNNTSVLQLAAAVDHRGHVTVLKSPTNPNDFHIDSFFDITFELSLDGGNSFLPATSSTELFENAIHTVPEPSSAALGMLGALGVFAIRMARRRRVR